MAGPAIAAVCIYGADALKLLEGELAVEALGRLALVVERVAVRVALVAVRPVDLLEVAPLGFEALAVDILACDYPSQGRSQVLQLPPLSGRELEWGLGHRRGECRA
jgi:hypothetical protein